MSVTLINNENNERYEFETIECTRGPKAVDFSKLFETTGFFLTIQGILPPPGANLRSAISMAKKANCITEGIE